ncbi:FAD/NAD(P)-binding domain-containing protein [Rhizoclosmatium globosum]|uniref:FAD/NAD(P)-binding domain-containing protein n=1 Tax=Rhizoclosmatium globosum TaxID=329046 RepID=A0A1Y2CDI4_9FUNG|nr:FAD/NAD(P)-binding domain-containing protein [Rhizoclosmatium globosum]|eukprot:ORY45109.1 FAD/NAD(P)-binding domain-containing protein [Rhizoclosmatium globosum]
MGKRVAIIGAGPAGVVAAIALKKQGYEPTLYDKIDPIESLKQTLVTGEQAMIQFGDVGGTVSLYGNGLRALDDKITRNLHTSKPGELEPMNLLRSEFHEVIMKASHTRGIKTYATKKFVSLTEHDSEVTVTFADGSTVTADFVIGADGINSRVRQCIFPDSPMPTTYGSANGNPYGPVGGHAVYNGTIAPTKGVFVVLDWNKPDGVQSDEVDWKPCRVESWGIDKHLVDCVRAAKRLSPVSLKDLPDLPVLYKGRVGLNLALEDAATLGDLFGHFQENEDVEKVFALYDQIRKPKVHELSAHSRSNWTILMRLVFTVQNIFALNDAILYHNYRTDIEEAVPGIKFN